jgi:hypothetical protein
MDGKSQYTGIQWHFIISSGHNCWFSKSTPHVAKTQQLLLEVCWQFLVKFFCEERTCSSATATYQCVLTLKCCSVMTCDVPSSCLLYFVSHVIGITVYSSAQTKQYPVQIIGNGFLLKFHFFPSHHSTPTMICRIKTPFYVWVQLQKPNAIKIWATFTARAKQI